MTMERPNLSPSEYLLRRLSVVDAMADSGIALFLGNSNVPMNYAENHYWFKQDASFRYLFGVDVPGCAGVIDTDTGNATLFAPQPSVESAIWEGAPLSTGALGRIADVKEVLDISLLPSRIRDAAQGGRQVHYLPPYRDSTLLELSRLLGLSTEHVGQDASIPLIRTLVQLREVKSDAEIAEIEWALEVTCRMHMEAMRQTRPGVHERDIVATMEAELRRSRMTIAYPPIFTCRGDVLHSRSWDNQLQAGQLVVNDSGACSHEGYASDITRTIPVSGRFTREQRDIYQIVLNAQAAAIDAARPGMKYADVHRIAAMEIAASMTGLGFFRGDPADVVATGAYAICFPHGVGHQMGLDVHDMEAFGEDHVGYDGSTSRSAMFGLSHLRMAKPLKPGMVVTVEPGIYFIAPLVHQWKAEGRFADLINYQRFEEYLGFGGIRIEDDVLVTRDGSRVLGPKIPKSCADVEDVMNSS
jgi:Xaa-Pro aminopeptidase